MIKPASVIYPDGGEPLYTVPGSGERLTAQDYAARYGMETKEFLDSLESMKIKIKKVKPKEEAEING